MSGVLYTEWAPPPEWTATVACFWRQEVGVPCDHRVIPDGCADVIVNNGRATAVGLSEVSRVHRLARGSACVGLRLRPAAVGPFFGVAADELTNREVPLDDVVGSARARQVIDTILELRPDPLLARRPPSRDRRALTLLGELSVDATAAALGMSTRQLRRLIVSHVGVSPKTYQRIVRLQRFLTDRAPLALAAATAGYADQAHLAREVTRMCGVSPSRLRRERTPVSATAGAARP